MTRRERDLKRLAKRFNRVVVRRRGGHLSLVDAAGTLAPAITPCTPSCNRSLVKLRADLRRAAKGARQ